ncbi:hypothetical protein ACKWTF_016001 [Chironomus riparius]
MSKCTVFNCENKRKDGKALFRMLLKPSPIFFSFCYKIEFNYRQCDSVDRNHSASQIKSSFKAAVKEIPTSFKHCILIFEDFLKDFLNFRLKLSHQKRFLNRKELFASKFK